VNRKTIFSAGMQIYHFFDKFAGRIRTTEKAVVAEFLFPKKIIFSLKLPVTIHHL